MDSVVLGLFVFVLISFLVLAARKKTKTFEENITLTKNQRLAVLNYVNTHKGIYIRLALILQIDNLSFISTRVCNPKSILSCSKS